MGRQAALPRKGRGSVDEECAGWSLGVGMCSSSLPLHHGLRRGKLTLRRRPTPSNIQDFKPGITPLTDGTTLHTFLSRLLNYDPMHISNKVVGGNCMGEQVFRWHGADVQRLMPAK